MTVELQKEVINHYSIPNLSKKILETLQSVKKDPTKYTREDFSTFDEFHIQGIQATKKLAKMVPIEPNMKILDLGSGIGGPARTLATEYHAEVTGIELVEEFYQSAKILSDLLKLGDRTKFLLGSALNLPFENNTFDVVWMQHMSMNIKDKIRLFSEAKRVLKPQGKLALYEICKGSGTNFHLPVPWANNETINHLIPIAELTEILQKLQLEQVSFQNVTQDSLSWFKMVLENAKSGPANPLGLQLVSSHDFGLKAKNVVKNLEEENIMVFRGVFANKK